MRKLELTVPEIVKSDIGRKAKTYFAFADSMSELADHAQANGRQRAVSRWSGNLSLDQAAQMCRTGDLSLVVRSDKLMSRFERFGFATNRKAWLRGVAGQRPDVPAFIAGHPMAMRRRVKLASDQAPLAIIVDLTLSADIGSEAIERRGAAILALCRVLSARRPVELWAGCITGADQDKNGVAMFARIDTAPLDLARAAFALISPAFPRQLLYSLARGAYGFAGHWPYQSHTASRNHLEYIMRPAMPHISEVLTIKAAHTTDAISANPEAWIESTLCELENKAAA